MERAESVDGSWEAFRVRAYEPAAERWTEYALSTDRPWLVRREASAAGGRELIAFQDSVAAGGAVTRSTWTAGDDGVTITVEDSEADGSWETASIVRLTERLDEPYRP